MRSTNLTGAALALALIAPQPAMAASPCSNLKPQAVERAIDYAMERSTRGALAESLDLDVRIALEHCEPQSRHRAVWRFRLSVRDATTELVREQGSVTVTRRRATWNPLGPLKGVRR